MSNLCSPRIFFILKHKKRILLKDKIYLILSTVFTITIIIIDFVTNGAYGYTKALLLCLIMWLLYFCVSSIIVKIVLNKKVEIIFG